MEECQIKINISDPEIEEVYSSMSSPTKTLLDNLVIDSVNTDIQDNYLYLNIYFDEKNIYFNKNECEDKYQVFRNNEDYIEYVDSILYNFNATTFSCYTHFIQDVCLTIPIELDLQNNYNNFLKFLENYYTNVYKEIEEIDKLTILLKMDLYDILIDKHNLKIYDKFIFIQNNIKNMTERILLEYFLFIYNFKKKINNNLQFPLGKDKLIIPFGSIKSNPLFREIMVHKRDIEPFNIENFKPENLNSIINKIGKNNYYSNKNFIFENNSYHLLFDDDSYITNKDNIIISKEEICLISLLY